MVGTRERGLNLSLRTKLVATMSLPVELLRAFFLSYLIVAVYTALERYVNLESTTLLVRFPKCTMISAETPSLAHDDFRLGTVNERNNGKPGFMLVFNRSIDWEFWPRQYCLILTPPFGANCENMRQFRSVQKCGKVAVPPRDNPDVFQFIDTLPPANSSGFLTLKDYFGDTLGGLYFELIEVPATREAEMMIQGWAPFIDRSNWKPETG